MNLVPPTSGSPERILVFGGPGSGKSSCWQSILIATPPDVIFHVVDTDNSWRDVQYQPQFDGHRDRIRLYEPFTWPEHVEAITKIRKNTTRQDWFVVDMADSIWDAVQDFYDDHRFAHASTWEEQMELMIDDTEADDDPARRWGPIKNMYRKWEHAFTHMGCNTLAATRQKEMKKSKGNWFREHKQHIRDFGRLGLRPAGEKNLPYDVALNVHLRKKAGGWEMEMIKDRKDEKRWDPEVRSVSNFAVDYLIGLAGWRPEGVSVE